jgi:hypothetical protein
MENVATLIISIIVLVLSIIVIVIIICCRGGKNNNNQNNFQTITCNFFEHGSTFCCGKPDGYDCLIDNVEPGGTCHGGFCQ